MISAVLFTFRIAACPQQVCARGGAWGCVRVYVRGRARVHVCICISVCDKCVYTQFLVHVAEDPPPPKAYTLVTEKRVNIATHSRSNFPTWQSLRVLHEQEACCRGTVKRE
jgi:hypothetical protein